MPHARDRGFTLFELVLALSLVGAAMLGALLLLDQLNDDTARIYSRGAAANRSANGERLLRRLVFDARLSADTTHKFVGDEHSVSMLSRCEVPGGWSEPCAVTLTIDGLGDSSAVAAELSLGGSFVLRRAAGSREWRYVDYTRRDSAWATRWSSATTLPAAVALVSASDTALLPVQVRRD